MIPQSRLLRWLAVAGLILVTLVLLGWDQTRRIKQVTNLADPEENFFYGGLTTGPAIPYELFVVLPEVFGDLMPAEGGWASFGLTVEEGRRVPIGFARQTVGYEGVTPNCALCHTGTFRVHPDSQRIIVPGAPARADVTALDRFLRAVKEDPRYRASELLPAMRQAGFDLSFAERLRYRMLIRLARTSVLSQDGAAEWMDARPDPGWGRSDKLSLLKFEALGMADDGTIGAADPHALWQVEDRATQRMHWAGVTRDVRQAEYMSLFSTTPGPVAGRVETFNRMRRYLADLAPPPFPFPVDEPAARRGRLVFEQTCAGCHEQGQGEVMPNAYVDTDAELLESWTDPLRRTLAAVNDPPFAFSDLTESDGYLNVRLDGVWMRAPYLHNGSVPTLRHLLEPNESRPETFFRWNDVYLPDWMGFEWTEPPPGSTLDAPFDTRLRGNGNGGHEFGIDLTDEQKDDLIEYLKTL